jgi:hypothetical protein
MDGSVDVACPYRPDQLALVRRKAHGIGSKAVDVSSSQIKQVLKGSKEGGAYDPNIARTWVGFARVMADPSC